MKIVLSVAVIATLLLTGCSEDSKKEVQKSEPVAAEKITPKEEIIVVVNEVVETTKDVTQDVIDEVVAVSKDVKAKASIAMDEAVAVAKESVTTVKALAVDGGVVYKGCAGCHGTNGEKVALGKSKVIQGWDATKVIEALNGYKDGSYGGAMKGVMKGQASKLSDAEIKAVSDYISKL